MQRARWSWERHRAECARLRLPGRAAQSPSSATPRPPGAPAACTAPASWPQLARAGLEHGQRAGKESLRAWRVASGEEAVRNSATLVGCSCLQVAASGQELVQTGMEGLLAGQGPDRRTRASCRLDQGLARSSWQACCLFCSVCKENLLNLERGLLLVWRDKRVGPWSLDGRPHYVRHIVCPQAVVLESELESQDWPKGWHARKARVIQKLIQLKNIQAVS